MKAVLLVGYDYSYLRELNKKYTDCLFIPSSEVDYGSAERLIELVTIVDEVLFIDDARLPFEVASVMMKKNISTKADYPVEEEKTTMEELSDTAKQIIVDTMRMPL